MGQGLARAYERFGIPGEFAARASLSRSELAHMLELAEPRIPEVPCAISPSSFDPEDPELRVFPRPLSWKWASAERALRALGARGILMRLPLFWQVEPALFDAGQSAGAPMFVNDQDNMPVGAAAIRSASLDTVVTDRGDAERFAQYLAHAKAQLPRMWILVHQITAPAWNLPQELRAGTAPVAQEVHLFPGVALLAQCETLARSHNERFHAASGWHIECGAGETHASSPSDDPLPLERLALGLSLRETGACACGETLLAREAA